MAAKEAAKKATTKATTKATAKTTTKTTTKKAAKKEMKLTTFVEFFGKQVNHKDVVADVKKEWTKAGNKVGEIETMELYIKPEESAVYYVINNSFSGSVAF